LPNSIEVDPMSRPYLWKSSEHKVFVKPGQTELVILDID